MEIIHNNPFRIAGVLSSATAKELQKNKAKLQAYSKVGREVKFDTDFTILKPVGRESTSIDEAFSKIQQSKDRVLHALFWFSEGNTFDTTALNYLKEGDEDKALEIWNKVTNDKEVSSNNYSSFNNIGTLKLLSPDNSDIEEGIEFKIEVLKSVHFLEFIGLVADHTYKIENRGQIELFVDEVLKQFRHKYSPTETISLFNRCNESTQSYLANRLAEEPLHKIEIAVKNNKKKRKENKEGAFDFGSKLFNETQDDLGLLKSVLGPDDLQCKMISDDLAKEILQSGIDYFKVSSKSIEETKNILKLIDHAYSIADGEQLKLRINQNIAGINDKIISDRLMPHFKKIKVALEENEKLYYALIHNMFYEAYLSLVSLKEEFPSIEYKEDNIFINNIVIGFHQLVVQIVNDHKKEDSSSQVKYIYRHSIDFLRFLKRKLESTEATRKKIDDTFNTLKFMVERLTANDWTLLSGLDNDPFSAKTVQNSVLYKNIKLRELKSEDVQSSSEYKTALKNLEDLKKWKFCRSEYKREKDIKIGEEKVVNTLRSLQEERKVEIAQTEEWLKDDEDLLKIINATIY